jgi:sugar O-acyltransferase (sialic acid O-acetyltransferase NeuD family)
MKFFYKNSSKNPGAASRVVVVGAAGHGLVVADAILANSDFTLIGFIDEDSARSENLGIAPIIGRNRDLPRLIGKLGINAVVVAIGDNWVRREVTEKIRNLVPQDIAFPSVVHPAATIGSKARIGAASVVLAGAVIGPGAVLGKGCLVNTGACLDHHGWMDDYASLAQGATLGGAVTLGAGVAVSIGAKISHGKMVGEWSVVAPGAVVLDDVPQGVLSCGIPASVQGSRKPNEKYL